MNDTVSPPRFRSTKRLVQWMDRNRHHLGYKKRLPPESERCFFRTKKETPKEVAACVARYANWVGALGPEFEALLIHCNDSVASYIVSVHGEDGEYGSHLLDVLKGDSRNLYIVANRIGRLPDHLERSITERRFAFLYAEDVLKGRLPPEMESLFLGSEYFCERYAIGVIRGFAPCRLPDELHNFMVMKSFEDPNNDHVRNYMMAVDNDPSKTGNTAT